MKKEELGVLDTKMGENTTFDRLRRRYCLDLLFEMCVDPGDVDGKLWIVPLGACMVKDEAV